MKIFFRDSIVRLAEVILGLLTRTETTPFEFISSTMLLWIGVMFSDPVTTLLAGTVPYHAAMLRIMPEREWGMLFVLLGIGQGVVNLLQHRRGRVVFSFMLALIFGFLSILGILVKPASIFFPVFGTLSFSMGVTYLCLVLRHPRTKGHA